MNLHMAQIDINPGIDAIESFIRFGMWIAAAVAGIMVVAWLIDCWNKRPSTPTRKVPIVEDEPDPLPPVVEIDYSPWDNEPEWEEEYGELLAAPPTTPIDPEDLQALADWLAVWGRTAGQTLIGEEAVRIILQTWADALAEIIAAGGVLAEGGAAILSAFLWWLFFILAAMASGSSVGCTIGKNQLRNLINSLKAGLETQRDRLRAINGSLAQMDIPSTGPCADLWRHIKDAADSIQARLDTSGEALDQSLTLLDGISCNGTPAMIGGLLGSRDYWNGAVTTAANLVSGLNAELNALDDQLATLRGMECIGPVVPVPDPLPG